MLELILPVEEVKETKYRRDAGNEDRIGKALSTVHCTSRQTCGRLQAQAWGEVLRGVVGRQEGLLQVSQGCHRIFSEAAGSHCDGFAEALCAIRAVRARGCAVLCPGRHALGH